MKRRNFLAAAGGAMGVLPLRLREPQGQTPATGTSTWAGHDVRAFGAVGDGKTDDTSAIKATVTATASGGGGWVVCPSGVYLISATIVLPHGVMLCGAGPRASILSAAPTFSGEHMVELGAPHDSLLAFGTQLRDLGIRGNDVAGLDCVYSNKANELSGLSMVELNRPGRYGVNFELTPDDTPSAQNYFIDGLYVLTGANTRAGVRIAGGGATVRGVCNFTISPVGNAPLLPIAILLDGVKGCRVSDGHVERTDVALKITDNCTGVTVTAVGGAPTVGTLVQIDDVGTQQGVALLGLAKLGGRTLIDDRQNRVTIPDQFMALYTIGGSHVGK